MSGIHYTLVDGDGRPLVVYRGEYGECEDAFHTRLPSLTFSSEEAAREYALNPNTSSDYCEAPRIISATLDIRRPLINDPHDPYLDLHHVIDGIGRAEAERLAVSFKHYAESTSFWEEELAEEFGSIENLIASAPNRLGEIFFPAWLALDDPEFIAAAKVAGFDGAVHGSTGATHGHPEYRVFSHEQARVVEVVLLREQAAEFGM